MDRILIISTERAPLAAAGPDDPRRLDEPPVTVES